MDIGDLDGFLLAGEVRGFIEGGSCVLERNSRRDDHHDDSDSRDEGENNEEDDLVGLGHASNLAEFRDEW